jgi:hypothetical protein
VPTYALAYYDAELITAVKGSIVDAPLVIKLVAGVSSKVIFRLKRPTWNGERRQSSNIFIPTSGAIKLTKLERLSLFVASTQVSVFDTSAYLVYVSIKHTHTHTHTHIYIYTFTRTYVYIYACMYVPSPTPTHTPTQTPPSYTHSYTHQYTHSPYIYTSCTFYS